MGYPVVLPALIPDIPQVYDAYFASFTNEAMARIMVDVIFPKTQLDSPEFRKQHAAGTLAYWHTSETQYTFKCVDNKTGEVMGMALGDILLRERSEEERKFTGIPWLEGKDRERAEQVIAPLAEIRNKLFGGKRHIYVHVIAVHPKHQRRGAARTFIEWGRDLVDRTALPMYLESSPTTQGLYRMMGFQLLKERVVHKAETLGTQTDIEVPLMVMMPSYANMTFDEWRANGYPDLDHYRNSASSSGSWSSIPVVGGVINRMVKALTVMLY
ncbi:hypothetical protein BX600DRAFT_509392 [Xylariales sp. PMI_506]|nr:hypothetical protein BX600DRAFT_509392 [Xylariales sp. PMI_506]